MICFPIYLYVSTPLSFRIRSEIYKLKNTVSNYVKSSDGYYYLVYVDSNSGKVKKTVGKVKKPEKAKGKITFKLNILMIEKGRPIEKRVCPKRKTKVCVGCKPCSITTGFAGAGAFTSDGGDDLICIVCLIFIGDNTPCGTVLDDDILDHGVEFHVDSVREKVFLQSCVDLRIR